MVVCGLSSLISIFILRQVQGCSLSDHLEMIVESSCNIQISFTDNFYKITEPPRALSLVDSCV